MIEYALLLYWLPAMQPFDYTMGGKKPLVTFPTLEACEMFRVEVDPKFATDCDERDVTDSGPGSAGQHATPPGERK